MNPVLQSLGLTPERVKVAAALAGKGLRVGRRGLPAEAVQRMYYEYQRLGSTHKVARLFGRSPQSIQEMFARRGLKLKPDSKARRGAVKEFAGLEFTRGKMGWRGTSGERRLLHQLIYEQHFGPIPAGQQVSFRNGDFEDFRPENLFCGTPAEVTRHHLRRLHPQLMALSPEARHARRKKIALQRYYRLRQKFWREGLRCDGQPLKRNLKGRGMLAVPNYFPPEPMAEMKRRARPGNGRKAENSSPRPSPQPVSSGSEVAIAWQKFREGLKQETPAEDWTEALSFKQRGRPV